jgi:L-amino acid N-acyltransferase YncA
LSTRLPLKNDVVIRDAQAEDVPAIARIYAHYVTNTLVSFEETAPGEDAIRERMLRMPRLPWLVATLANSVWGYAYASSHRQRAAYRWAADVSVYVDTAMQRRGIGKRLYEELFAILERLHYRRLCAGVTLPNAASEGLHRAMGFTPVGIYRKIGWKFGAWHDTLWMQRDIGAADGPPEEILELIS